MDDARDNADATKTNQPSGVEEAHETSASALLNPSYEVPCKYKFSAVLGFFIDYATEAVKEDGKVLMQEHLGLLPIKKYDGEGSDAARGDSRQWARFEDYVRRLNAGSEQGESYKLIFIIRHGYGVHNQWMEEVGSQAWKDDWSHRNGNGKDLEWMDAHLVDTGIEQAQAVGEIWLGGVEKDGMPLPQTIYTSPLARCLQTTKLVYKPVFDAQERKLRPVVKELLRELVTDHTCDQRRSKAWIQATYPDYEIEDGFAETDQLWRPHESESLEAHVRRKQQLLDDIFSHDSAPFISLTTHSYAISAILKVVGAPLFRVGEGVMFPLLVKAEKL